MKQQGIPRSPERRVQQVIFLLVACGLFALVGALFWILNIRGVTPPALDLESISNGADSLEPFLEEHERASAYALLRDYIDEEMRKKPKVSRVFCRDSRHHIIGRYFEFRGDVDIEYLNGLLQRFEYIATLSGSSRSQWEVISFTYEPSEIKPLAPPEKSAPKSAPPAMPR